ncbi:TMEM175 family protein [Pedobacter sp. Leaf176]|uniref:TMEM175 family protein n=1 Tax=Pedobacter sp. Leaf176 TaxID=1736286 RepID=UPI0006FFD96C|nr:TMEM175 family protein [Pedobacter sp. Leaf176]KQR71150.1 tellurium resistance protein TerC [Pedobacter sp. Leaf176]
MEKETARIEAFSDGVFAIAITLLVLELHIPELKMGDTSIHLLEALKKQWPGYVAFIISFFSIFIVWVNHHKVFKQIYKRNTGLMFANGLILFLVSLVSFPSALLTRFYLSGSKQLSVTIYTGMFVLVNLAFNLLWQQASSDKKLLRPGISDTAIRELRNNYLYGFPTYLAAFITSFFYPDAALLICILLWIFWAISSKKINFSESPVD